MKYQYIKAPNPTEFSVTTGLGKEVLDLKTIAKDVPCQEACPAKTNVPAYIEKIFQNDFDAAYRINQEDNVFPGVLGRVCTRPCEDACRHQWTNVEGPVQICHLKRSSADNHIDPATPLPNWFDKTDKRIAIIGGGPSGLAAARELTRYGHLVTIFEREDHLGGMMVDGIPKFRLPREIPQKEIDLVVNSGVEIRYNTDINKEKLEELRHEYDAVIVAIGTMVPTKLNIDGIEQVESVYGLDFMKGYNNGEITKLNGDVVIIGGGFTAVDCARSSARAARKLLGNKGEVTIVYRRSERFMSATNEELDEIKYENIDIRTLCTPNKVITENGELKAVRFTRNILEDDETTGKPKMIPVANSEFDIPCKHLIMAIGQKRDWDILPEGVELHDDQTTSDPKVFVSGDFFDGGSDVIHAVAQGKAVADKIDMALMGQQRKKLHVMVTMANDGGETGRTRDHDLQSPHHMPTIDLLQRVKDDAEVETGLVDEGLKTAASRCYLCHYKFEINQDKCIHCDWCIDVAPRSCIKRVSRIFTDSDNVPIEYTEATKAEEATYIYIDSDECIRCGKCLRVCPTEAITMRKMERVTCSINDLKVLT